MFNKNDPLIGSVKQVMAENQVRRDVEKQLNEELGIHSKKALPFEYHAEYDALLEQRIAEANLDPVGKADRDIDNDGDHDKTDKYLHNRRAAISKAIRKKNTMSEEQLDELSKETTERYAEKANKQLDRDYQTTRGIDKDGIRVKLTSRERERIEDRIDKREKGLEMAAKRKRLKEEEGEETREGGAVKYNGKTVVSPTAHKAQPEGPSKSDRDALTAKIKGIMKEAAQLDEKAVSKAQQRFFGLVRGIQKGEAKGSEKAEKAAKEMSTKEVKKYAKTKQKGLPEKVDEDFDFDAVMEEIRANLGEEAFAALMAETDQPSPAQQGARNPRQALDISVGRTQTTGPQAGVVPSPVSRENDMPANKAGEDSAFSPPNIAAQRQQAPVRPGTTPTMSARSEIAASKEAGVPDTRTDIRAPITAPKGEGATGRALAASGVSRAERRSQAFVDKELGAGKFKAGSAEANIALQKKFQSQRDTAMAREKASTYTAPTPPPRPAGLRESLETTIKKVLKG